MATNSTLPKAVFAVEVPNHELLKLAYEAYLANSRLAGAKTLRRGEVRGGGKKPHKQKGTGRARAGSIRSPLWRGGGVTFGPLGIENYKKLLNAKAKRTAVRQALTLAAQANKIIAAELTTTGKTREVVAFLSDQKADARRVLLVVDAKSPEMIRATKNLQNITLVRANYLSVFHVLNADKIIMSPAAIAATEAWLGEEKA
jgi:large subunit ribosomal protein L4